MDFIPYSRQTISEDDIAAVTAVLRGDMVTQGPAVDAFETLFARVHEVPYAVAVSNATSGLHLACQALGVGPTSRVWTSPNSFLASANCARYCGAAVDFVDIDPATRNLSIAALTVKLDAAARTGTLPDVVIPVHFAGLPCDMRELRALADRHGFRILEDASHATGARYLGRPVGSAWADATVFSFHAVKILTTAEGGMVTTRDVALAQTVRSLRSHAVQRDAAQLERDGAWTYRQEHLGWNCRMTDVQAALGASQLTRLDAAHAQRAALADRYDTLLAPLPLKLPARLTDRDSAWHLYVVELTDPAIDRRAVFDAMRAAQIGVNVHYIPIHTQPYYQRLGFKAGDYPSAEAYYARALSLPLFPAMTRDEQDRVATALREAVEQVTA